MRAWVVRKPGPITAHPLELAELPDPTPGPSQVLIQVRACGVCRTDLHVAEGDLPVHKPDVVPGHQVVGTVVAAGEGCEKLSVGDRVGVAWLGHTCGTCDKCISGHENLCSSPLFTGWDIDGGYAEYMVAWEDFAYRLPEGYDDIHAAPLLCSGIIGYRALSRTHLSDTGVLGIYGFGASAHITAQIALARGARLHVMTRSPEARRLALELGAASAQGAYDPPPEPLDAAILFAPVGDLVPVALEALGRGGVLVIAGIHLSHVPSLNYERHLFYEKDLRSVTANTREDGQAFLQEAARFGIRVHSQLYPMAQADQGLVDLAEDRVNGSAVLIADWS
jgi:propanol-preferring alcohol dehydrogenase